MLHRDSFDPRGHIAEGAPLARVGSGHQVKGARAKAGKLLSAMWRGGGIRTKSENQPHALGYAPGQALRSENTEREALPVASDG